MKTLFTLILLFTIPFCGNAQERLKRGAIYQQGEAIFAPMVGYKGVVPTGWYGTIPQGDEFFLMLPNSNAIGYMFINANKQSLPELEAIWKGSFALTDNIIISMKGSPKISGNTMSADFTVSGAREPATGYAHAIDGGNGWTIVMILLTPVTKDAEFRQNFNELILSSVVEPPSIATLHGDFNWAERLKSKYLMSYISQTNYTEQNEIWLCPDGTFRSKIMSKGMLKLESSDYRGSKNGTWTAEGIGEKGSVTFTFTKKPPVTAELEIKDDKYFFNGVRIFVLENKNCK
ncbi:MAG: hypothetical protein U5K79_25960 [Cyclobacteriaceae bacterium]|nr:hypothetical protein [Cyclobacteriaceae bacterium]